MRTRFEWYVGEMPQIAKEVPIGHAFSLQGDTKVTRVRIARPMECSPDWVYSVETHPEFGAFCRTREGESVVHVSVEPVDISFELPSVEVAQ